MRNIPGAGQDTQPRAGGPAPNLRALRACESRIHALQNPGAGGHRQGVYCRHALLQAEVGQALYRARLCIEEGDFRQATPATLAGMMNSFSRMRTWPVSHNMDAILGCIGQEVSRRVAQGALAHWSPRHQALVANGLGKGQGPMIQQALRHLAQALLRLGPLTPEAGWDIQYLAMMTNGLSKGEGPDAQQALSHLARHLPCYLPGVGEWLRESVCAPRHLAMLANGLSKGEGLWIQEGLACLARAVLRAPSQAMVSDWSAQHLAMTVNGLSKGEGPDISQALRLLAQTICGHAPGVIQRWGALDLAMIANGLSKCEGPWVLEALTRLAQGLPAGWQLTAERGWTAQRMAITVNGLSKGEGAAIREALAGLAQALLRAQPLTTESGWSCHHLAMMANGLAKGEGPCVDKGLTLLARTICERKQEVLQQWELRELAMMAHGLGKGEGPPIQRALACLAQALHGMEGLTAGRDWTVQHMAMMIHGLGKGEGREVHQALTRLVHILLARQPAFGPGWSAQSLALVANGLVKVQGPYVQQALTHMARALVARGELTPASGWTVRTLVMVTNGLSKGEGEPVREALAHLAGTVLSIAPPDLAAWTAQHLSLMSNGLSKGEGDRVQGALERLARALREQDLEQLLQWSAHHLAMMTNGLAKGRGPQVQEALAWLAQVIVRMDRLSAQSWTAQPLAMMANGLAKGEGQDIKSALARLAQALPGARQLTAASGWDARHLSMMTNALAKGEGIDIRNALTRLGCAFWQQDPAVVQQEWAAQNLAMMAQGLSKGEAAAVWPALVRIADHACQLPLASEQECTSLNLVMLMDGTGQALAGHAVFEALTAALVQRVQQAPEALVRVLALLSRFALASPHLQSARRLLEALRGTGWGPGTLYEHGEMLWNITLFHFASQQQQPEDPALTEAFAQFYRHRWGQAPLQDDGVQTRSNDRWHSSWTCAYWQLACAPDNSGTATMSLVDSAPVDSAPVDTGLVSHWQYQVFRHLQEEMPDHDVHMEARIRDFPVDILIDGRVCVEVDGPDHFVEVPAVADDLAGGLFVRERRTKDLFIDHMLRQYGYQVFRITDAQDQGKRDELVRQVMAALETPPPWSLATEQAGPHWPQDRPSALTGSPPAPPVAPGREKVASRAGSGGTA